MNVPSKSTLSIALVLAFISHTLLLLLKVSFSPPDVQQNLPITVRLQEEIIEPTEQKSEPEPQKQSKEIEKQELKKEPSQQAKPKPSISPREVITKTAEPTEETTTTTAPIRLSDFKNVIIQDAKNYFSKNPDKLDALDKTFEFKSTKQAPVTGESKEAQAQFRQRDGGRTIDENGKHTCFAIIRDLSSAQTDDFKVFTDCTPKKKFELDLDAPNNG